MQPPRRQIAIAGAGPAGLAFARAAPKSGVCIHLFERAEGPRLGGGGLLLHGNGKAVLSGLGLLERLEPCLRPVHRIEVVLAERPHRVYVQDLSVLPPPFDSAAVVLRRDLMRVLIEGAEEASATIHYGHRLESARVIGSTVHISFADRQQSFGADLLIGADGVRSRTREAAGLPARIVPLGQAYLRGVSKRPPEVEAAREILLSDGRRFGLAPLPGDRTYFYCTAPFGAWDEVRATGLEAWIDGWREAGETVIETLREVEDWDAVVYDEIREVRCKRWCAPPIFLAGDAAHAMAPNLGQGANSALVDVWVLARLLRDLGLRDLSNVAARYQAIRQPFVGAVQRLSRQTGTLFSASNALSRLFLRASLPLGQALPSLGRRSLALAAGFNPREAFLLPDSGA